MFIRKHTLVPVAVSLALVTALSGCGNSNKKACEQLKAAMTDFTKNVSSQTDVNAMSKQMTDTAAKVRKIAADASGDVKSSAITLADSMDSLGSGSSTAEPDTAKLDQATSTLDKECP